MSKCLKRIKSTNDNNDNVAIRLMCPRPDGPPNEKIWSWISVTVHEKTSWSICPKIKKNGRNLQLSMKAYSEIKKADDQFRR